eukprot:scaffold7923_cov107-Cylindrotheca_fusiformis.AAC.1
MDKGDINDGLRSIAEHVVDQNVATSTQSSIRRAISAIGLGHRDSMDERFVSLFVLFIYTSVYLDLSLPLLHFSTASAHTKYEKNLIRLKNLSSQRSDVIEQYPVHLSLHISIFLSPPKCNYSSLQDPSQQEAILLTKKSRWLWWSPHLNIFNSGTGLDKKGIQDE